MKTLPIDFKPVKIYYPEHKPNDIILHDGENYLLEHDYNVLLLSENNQSFRITVKKDYIYNGFSVPSGFRFVQGKHDDAIGISLLHDLDYDCHWSNTRSNADYILLLGLIDRKYNWVRRNLIYSAVRSFGWSCYKKSKEHIKFQQQYIKIEKV